MHVDLERGTTFASPRDDPDILEIEVPVLRQEPVARTEPDLFWAGDRQIGSAVPGG